MHDHLLAQFVQISGAGGPPIFWEVMARPHVALGETFRHVGKLELVERPALDPRLGAIQRRQKAQARRLGQARVLRRRPQSFQLGADRFPGLRRHPMRHRAPFGIG
jgi:hypothetical protein